MSVYDIVAPTFDRDRVIPHAALEAIRTAMLDAVASIARPWILDVGAGTGRIGLPFVAAGSDYVGVDLSLGMLRQFAEGTKLRMHHPPRLVQADGQHLPFRDAAFDAVMLIQVFGGLRGWRKLLAEVRRVLTPAGLVFVGQSVVPSTGLDAQMKQHLGVILAELGVRAEKKNAREDVLRWLQAAAQSDTCVTVATWDVERAPRGFLSRHLNAASFSTLPAPVKERALSRLSAWAVTRFGSLDAPLPEQHSFELRTFQFLEEGMPG